MKSGRAKGYKTARTSAAKKGARTHVKRGRGSARKAAAYDFITPPGYLKSNTGILVPIPKNVVPASKLKKGVGDAKRYMEDILGDFLQTMGEDYEIAEIELSASFSADGKFLGFGVGGDASIKLKVRPSRDT